MMRVLAFAILLSAGLPVAAQEPMEAKKLTDDFVSVCATAMRSKEEGGATAVLRGYSPIGSAKINAVMSGANFGGGSGNFNIMETVHKDATNVMCMMSLLQPLSIDEIKALKAEIEKSDIIGPMDGDIGSPEGMPDSQKIIMGSYKRPGNNPSIYFSVTSMERFTNLILTKSTFQ
jgi:hypothetical protein